MSQFDEKAMEFWIKEQPSDRFPVFESEICQTVPEWEDFANAIHVIEKSAYDKQTAKIAELEEKLRMAVDALKAECCCTGETNWTTGKSILCDACEALEKLREQK